MNWTVYFMFPENHEDYKIFGDSMFFTDLMFAEDFYDECIENGAIHVILMQHEIYGGIEVDSKILKTYGEE